MTTPKRKPKVVQLPPEIAENAARFLAENLNLSRTYSYRNAHAKAVLDYLDEHGADIAEWPGGRLRRVSSVLVVANTQEARDALDGAELDYETKRVKRGKGADALERMK